MERRNTTKVKGENIKRRRNSLYGSCKCSIPSLNLPFFLLQSFSFPKESFALGFSHPWGFLLYNQEKPPSLSPELLLRNPPPKLLCSNALISPLISQKPKEKWEMGFDKTWARHPCCSVVDMTLQRDEMGSYWNYQS